MAACHNRDEGAGITSFDLKLILEVRAKVLLPDICLSHCLGECSARHLTNPTHLQHLILALEDSQFIEYWAQRPYSSGVDDALKFIRYACAVQVSEKW